MLLFLIFEINHFLCTLLLLLLYTSCNDKQFSCPVIATVLGHQLILAEILGPVLTVALDYPLSMPILHRSNGTSFFYYLRLRGIGP